MINYDVLIDGIVSNEYVVMFVCLFQSVTLKLPYTCA